MYIYSYIYIYVFSFGIYLYLTVITRLSSAGLCYDYIDKVIYLKMYIRDV